MQPVFSSPDQLTPAKPPPKNSRPSPHRIINFTGHLYQSLTRSRSHSAQASFLDRRIYPRNKNSLSILATIEPSQRSFVVLDNQMSQSVKVEPSNIFSLGPQQRNRTFVFSVQILCAKCKVKRTISINLHNIMLFKTSRDEGQMIALAQQAFPTKVTFWRSMEITRMSLSLRAQFQACTTELK